eukprot:CAMPEP_0180192822 /NCGR_PEP_ID=MMETSP0987-20121128/2174_1 /TAXON_ID=697907 /ORGANISM="non described non described, Strain CCMP2293" /LENGTH=475 /DNA_ID=CAMNT_0022147453 /DNA_START=57 /DNA_END=1484 /DNA_ORIENTATION=+
MPVDDAPHAHGAQRRDDGDDAACRSQSSQSHSCKTQDNTHSALWEGASPPAAHSIERQCYNAALSSAAAVARSRDARAVLDGFPPATVLRASGNIKEVPVSHQPHEDAARPKLSGSQLQAQDGMAPAPDALAREKKAQHTRERILQTRALAGTTLASPRVRALESGKVPHAVVMLDLDKTSLYGNDGNDLPLSLQWQDKPHSVVEQLYKLLVSPNIRPALNLIHGQAEEVTVTIYTRRPQVVHYTSPHRQEPVRLLFNAAWHQGGQLLLPGHVKTAADMMREYSGEALLTEERRDVEKILERLLAARDAVASELGLSYTPSVVVTATGKVVEGTAAALGLPGEHAVLFDDNTDLASNAKVVSVEPLNSLPEHQRQRVLAFMQRHLPAEHLTEDLREFLLGAHPAECSVRTNAVTHALEWHVPAPATPLKLWANPGLRPTRNALPQRPCLALDWATSTRPRARAGKGSALILCAAA